MLVISAKSGSLGNRLLLFAHFIAFALENNFIVFNPAFEEYAEFFQGSAKDLFCRYPTTPISFPGNNWLRKQYYKLNRNLVNSGKFNIINIQRDRPFNWSNGTIKIEDLQANKLNFFQGWLLRDGWFIEDLEILRKHRQAICNYFQPLKKYQKNVAELISRTRVNTDILIGIHIRQGDYLQHQNGRYFYPTAAYVKIMESAQLLFPDKKMKFLICSNQKQDEQNFQHLSCTYGNNHLVEDMYSLAECDYIIGPPSSYTMWASFYGQRPLYMIRDINKAFKIGDFVHFYQWQGIFSADEDWSKNFWEWTH